MNGMLMWYNWKRLNDFPFHLVLPKWFTQFVEADLVGLSLISVSQAASVRLDWLCLIGCEEHRNFALANGISNISNYCVFGNMVRADVCSHSQQHETFAPCNDVAMCFRGSALASPRLTCLQTLIGPLKVGSDWRLTSLLLSSHFIPTVSLLFLQSRTLLETSLITWLLYCLLVFQLVCVGAWGRVRCLSQRFHLPGEAVGCWPEKHRGELRNYGIRVL